MRPNFFRQLLLVLAAAGTLSGCGGAKYMKPAMGPAPDPGTMANVVFIRPSNFGGAIRFIILDDKGNFVGESARKSYFIKQVEPGRHLFIAWSENTSSLEATVEAGKTYYVHVQPTMGAFKAQVQLKAIKPGTDTWEDLQGWMEKAKRLELDGTKGDAYVQSKAEKVQKRVATGIEKWNDSYSDDKKEDRTLRPEDGK